MEKKLRANMNVYRVDTLDLTGESSIWFVIAESNERVLEIMNDIPGNLPEVVCIEVMASEDVKSGIARLIIDRKADPS